MADNTNRVAGTASLTWNGRAVLLKGDFSCKPDSATRESMMGLDGYHGYKELPTPGEVKATLRDWGGMSVNDLADATNIPIVFELANGKTWAGQSLTPTEAPSVSADEGTIEMTWQGPRLREV